MANALRQSAGTPPDLFDALHREYGFTVDICASDHNHKLPAYHTEGSLDGVYRWLGERVWCNPPYIDIPSWLAYCSAPIFSAYLLPARTDRDWWRRYKPLAECHYFVGQAPYRRIQFVAPPGVEFSSNPDCNALLLFGRGAVPGLEVWRSGRTGERV